MPRSVVAPESLVRRSRRASAAAVLAALMLVGCIGRDPVAVHSVDDPRLRDGSVPSGQLTALQLSMAPDQLAVLQPGYSAPLAIVGGYRIGQDLLMLRLRAQRSSDDVRADALQWGYAVDCRDGTDRLLAAGIGVDAGWPSRAPVADIAEPTITDRRRAFALACAHRVDCELKVAGNRCEQAARAWLDMRQAPPRAPAVS
ncbi:hypothetical protein M0D46_02705 [Xanthomonas prunicola]|uniref:Uncharacterized protein n=1 Tax=Xanthomonas prunicola TaxID=2053930 RepID=A0A9Q9J0G4_9XANT|nr:hypothetical protein [Xanthomonas prunicola]UXA50018.1 hypothetical protein M0D44_05645 [Xanthomonas prunicola]UXA52255.1 hypothetical protein M0D45_16435 [Xanthomonas prunicola]UXA58322.1 hypothetical protein M0D47_05680 [Xanthomonas prunicola]UXA60468.1 hypothetical protein M0D48_15965 [Xanthomonas prunicola]UXA66534.1 hypothetical protein M0D43_05895 [Xanthomonas prunicola]